MPKSWQHKFDNERKPEIETSGKPFGGVPSGVPFLISTPAEIDAYIRKIPFGKEVSFDTVKRDIARTHGVEYMCPLTGGIFFRIIAERAFEQYSQGIPIDQVTPFWRVLNSRMPLAKKVSFGVDFIREQRKKEGLKD